MRLVPPSCSPRRRGRHPRLAGCSFGASSDPVDVAVRNADERTHTVTVTVTGDFSPVARATTVAPGETVPFEDVIPILDYPHEFTVEVVVDDAVVSRTRHSLRDRSLEGGELTLTVERPERVTVDAPTVSPTSS